MSEESELRILFTPAVLFTGNQNSEERRHEEVRLYQKCGQIHYENPHNIVGTVPVYNGKVLFMPPGELILVSGNGICLPGHQEMKEGRHDGRSSP